MIEAEGSRYPGEPIQKYFDESHEAWREWGAQSPSVGSFVLPLAPDRLHKDNVSGGVPYGIILPDTCVDGPLRRRHGHAVPQLGFPEWRLSWLTGSQNQWQVKHALAKDILPL